MKEAPKRLRKHDRYVPDFPPASTLTYDDLDVLAQPREAVHEFPLGNASELAAHQLRELGLGQAEVPRGRSLTVAALPDDFRDLADELCFHQHSVRVSKAEI